MAKNVAAKFPLDLEFQSKLLNLVSKNATDCPKWRCYKKTNSCKLILNLDKTLCSVSVKRVLVFMVIWKFKTPLWSHTGGLGRVCQIKEVHDYILRVSYYSVHVYDLAV